MSCFILLSNVFFFSHLNLYFLYLLFWERERERESQLGGAKGKGERERLLSRFDAQCKRDTGLHFRILRSWPELKSRVGHSTDRAIRYPYILLFREWRWELVRKVGHLYFCIEATVYIRTESATEKFYFIWQYCVFYPCYPSLLLGRSGNFSRSISPFPK